MRFYDFPLSAAESAAAADPNDRDHYSYGGGRRICPGMHVAERSLFIDIARLMWGFDIRNAKDETGREIPVDATFGGMLPGATATPKPFKCGMTLSRVS
jgi:cytochrome P450